jgi:muconate cycloisomerase
MKITEVRTFPATLTVRPEFMIVSSAGKHAVSRYVFVQIITDGGINGWGEATVVPVWSGETQGGAMAVIRDYATPILVGRDIEDVEALMSEIDAAVLENFFTKAAVEMALLDALGRKKGEPVYEIMGGEENPLRIPIKFSIGLREPEDAAHIALEKVAQGFTALKMKVGPNAEKDVQRVKLVREAVGPKIKLNVDVNGGWSVEESIKQIPRYEPYALEYVEQPTPRWDIDGLAKVRANSPLPIMADEAVFAIWQAEEVVRKKAADLLSIYPGKHGGIRNTKRISELAADAGVACHIGSNLEWDIGTAAMCHAAAACANVTVSHFPVDILGPLYYSTHPKKTPVVFEGGHVNVPPGPGLGMQIDPAEMENLTEADGANFRRTA